MLFVSSRKTLENENQIGTQDQFFDLRIRRGLNVAPTDPPLEDGLQTLKEQVAGKRVLLLVHGYNNEWADVIRAYAVIDASVRRLMRNKYDLVVGYTWPGGDDRFDYFAAKTRAGALSPRFQELLRELHSRDTRPAALDLMTHSMGARLSLEALSLLSTRNVVRNLFLMAAAVDNESVERGEEYFAANKRVRNSFIFHSKNDQVLNLAFRLAEFDRALGLHGPEDPADVMRHAAHTLVVNCKHHIKGHGDYKSEEQIYRFLNRNVDQVSSSQFSTL